MTAPQGCRRKLSSFQSYRSQIGSEKRPELYALYRCLQESHTAGNRPQERPWVGRLIDRPGDLYTPGTEDIRDAIGQMTGTNSNLSVS
jgi:hypothetical protein